MPWCSTGQVSGFASPAIPLKSGWVAFQIASSFSSRVMLSAAPVSWATMAARIGLGAVLVGEVAKPVEPAFSATYPDGEEHAGNVAGLEFRHAEHAGSHEKRRQEREHEVVLLGGNLEILAGIGRAGNWIDTRGVVMPVEELEHLLARGDAVEHLPERSV